MKIGFDFGMTNSTISFINKSGVLENFRLIDSGDEYIPTVVSYNIKGDVFIGDTAKSYIVDSRYDTYERFKLLLGSKFDIPVPGKDKSSSQAAQDFIKNLFKGFRKKESIEGASGQITGIVMTIPAIWALQTSNLTAKENIVSIFNAINYGSNLKLVSEPSAAAAFFCHSFKERYSHEYKGFITVIDFGGGTLDITLCEATGTNAINELKTFGDDDVKPNGQAGVAFDNAVVDKLLVDNGFSQLPIDNEEFIELRDKFEKTKIAQSEEIAKQLEIYYSDEVYGPAALEDEFLFELRYSGKKLPVRCKDLVECFNEVNRTHLLSALEEAQEYFNAYDGIDFSSQTNFRVLLVGGFSNFYSVEHEVRKFFSGISAIDDDKFENLFPPMNRSFAISRGAALIARDMRVPVQTCPYEIGYVIYGTRYNGEEDVLVPEYISVIRMGTKLTELAPIEWSKRGSVTIDHTEAYFRIYFNDGRPNDKGRKVFKLNETVKSHFPNTEERGNTYRIGVAMKNAIPFLCIEDKNGTMVETSLFKLYEKLSIREKGE